MATIAEAAAHLFLDERRFRELVGAGVITKADRGAYALDLVREQYVTNLREVAAGRVQTGDLDPAQEKARRDKEYADHLAMWNAATRGEVVHVDAVVAIVTEEHGVVRNKLLGLPSRAAPSLTMRKLTAPEVHTFLMAEVIAILGEVSSPERVVAKAQPDKRLA